MVAIAAAVALVLSAPFVGQIRSAVRAAFPGQYLLIIAGTAALGLAAALASAAWRIRDRRPARYGVIALAILIAVGYSALDRVTVGGDGTPSSASTFCSTV